MGVGLRDPATSCNLDRFGTGIGAAMSAQNRDGLTRRAPRRAPRAVVHALAAARTLWRLIRTSAGFVLQVLAALILLFEEWGWRPLVDALAVLARFRIVARLEQAIAGLPPYGALAALALPTSILFPLKLLAVYLVANGQVLAAGLLFVGAKIASTALIARLFLLTRPALMRIGWFAAAYGIVMPWKEALFARIRASWAWRYGRLLKSRVRLEVRRAWARLEPRLAAQALRLRTTLRRALGRP